MERGAEEGEKEGELEEEEEEEEEAAYTQLETEELLIDVNHFANLPIIPTAQNLPSNSLGEQNCPSSHGHKVANKTQGLKLGRSFAVSGGNAGAM